MKQMQEKKKRNDAWIIKCCIEHCLRAKTGENCGQAKQKVGRACGNHGCSRGEEPLLAVYYTLYPVDVAGVGFLLDNISAPTVGPQYLKTFPGSDAYLEFVLDVMSRCADCLTGDARIAVVVWSFRYDNSNKNLFVSILFIVDISTSFGGSDVRFQSTYVFQSFTLRLTTSHTCLTSTATSCHFHCLYINLKSCLSAPF
nr:unnamed protein product [Callosobruchus analis]